MKKGEKKKAPEVVPLRMTVQTTFREKDGKLVNMRSFWIRAEAEAAIEDWRRLPKKLRETIITGLEARAFGFAALARREAKSATGDKDTCLAYTGIGMGHDAVVSILRLVSPIEDVDLKAKAKKGGRA